MSLGDTVRRTPRVRPSPGSASPSSASTSCCSHRTTSIRTHVRPPGQPLALHQSKRCSSTGQSAQIARPNDTSTGEAPDLGGVTVGRRSSAGGSQVAGSAATWSPERMSLTSPPAPRRAGTRRTGCRGARRSRICLPNLSAVGRDLGGDAACAQRPPRLASRRPRVVLVGQGDEHAGRHGARRRATRSSGEQTAPAAGSRRTRCRRRGKRVAVGRRARRSGRRSRPSRGARSPTIRVS